VAEPLIILAENEKTPLEVMFNPNTYSISKQNYWEADKPRYGAEPDRKTNAPVLTFRGGGSRTLSFQLFFDVTDSTDEGRDVRDETDKIVKLSRIVRELGRPPICTINWGGRKTKDFPFKGTITQLTQQFTLFHTSGRPLRAVLTVSFIEFLRFTDDQLETDPDLQTRTVRRGDTLAIIAAQVYGNPARWRDIALANRIEKPLQLAPGTKLTLPKL
jgi:hypothetical protein